MVSWSEVEKAEPEFAAKVRRLFDARKHKTIATLRVDGSPRISGIEAGFTGGELTFGSMPRARKGADLHRDPRFALHSPTSDPPDDDSAAWPGEAKIAGRAYFAQVLDGAEGPEGELFRVDVDEVVITFLNHEGTLLVVESWHPGRGLRRTERA
ncbi:MAG: pyridoxamine 5'-phosphate oxidase family protein [Pseudonocardia sp.]|nr:pyridoxamine 5'-phosphate oxidase family protein [Pseudonocardia sp.]